MARAGNCTYYQDCNLQSLPLEDLFKALIVQDGNGCWHINTVVNSGDCSTLSQMACATGESWEDMFRKTIVLDDCGLPAISLFYNVDLN